MKKKRERKKTMLYMTWIRSSSLFVVFPTHLCLLDRKEEIVNHSDFIIIKIEIRKINAIEERGTRSHGKAISLLLK